MQEEKRMTGRDSDSVASASQWVWVWANSRKQWRTGKSGVLQSMGSQSWTQLSDWTITTNGIQSRHFMANWRGKSGSSYIFSFLCDPMDCSPLPPAAPCSSVHGILQARILEWVATLQGIFLTKEMNLHLLHCRQILYHWATREGLEWIVCGKTNCQKDVFISAWQKY